jgi:hypothetical protein
MTRDEFRDLIQRAEQGDKSTLAQLQEVMMSPEAVEFFGGDLAKTLEKNLVANAAGKNLPFQEAILRKLQLLREDTTGSNVAPLEKLLVDRIACCWLVLYDAEVRYVQGNMSIPQGDYHQRRIDRLHRRFLSAIKMLAVVRRLALPVVHAKLRRDTTRPTGFVPRPWKIDLLWADPSKGQKYRVKPENRPRALIVHGMSGPGQLILGQGRAATLGSLTHRPS